MKKLFLLGALFAAGLSFTACSDKEVEADISPEAPTGSNGYLAISVNMPTQSANTTRAGEDKDQKNNVVFNDGLAAEYEVKDATIIIFNNTDNFVEAHSISNPSKQTNTEDPNVTATISGPSTQITLKVSNKVTAGFKMLAILNKNDLFTVDGESIKFNNVAFTGSFSDFQAKLATTEGLNDAPSMTGTVVSGDAKGFFMSNAPLTDTQGGTTAPTAPKVQVLVPISNVYKTSSEATAANADQIYVERGVAKVTFQKTAASAGKTFSVAKVNGNASLYYETTSWTLDNTNKYAFLVRETGSFNDFALLHSLKDNYYRTLGETGITHTKPTYKYRVYFSKSKDYETTSATDVTPSYLNKVDNVSAFKSDFYEDETTQNPQYCFENTFPVSKQSLKYTTLVQLALTAKTSTGGAAEDLYTKESDKSTIYTKATIETELGNLVIAKINDSETPYLNASQTASAEDFEVATSTPEAGDLTSVTLKLKSSAKEKYATAAYTDGDVLVSALQPDASYFTSNKITRYKGGVSYYNIRIKHFGDLTPWNEGEYSANTYAPSGTSTETIYNGADDAEKNNNYLGRYGVLRNNWYHISVNTVRFLGDATPNTTKWDDTADDEADQYISTQINILSWAKRTQGADL